MISILEPKVYKLFMFSGMHKYNIRPGYFTDRVYVMNCNQESGSYATVIIKISACYNKQS